MPIARHPIPALPAPPHRVTKPGRVALVALLSTLAAATGAQTTGSAPPQDLLNAGPRGLIDAAPVAARSQSANPALQATPAVPGQAQSGLPLPTDPATSPVPLMFGSQMFSGRFASEAFSGFNPEYRIAVGDRVTLRMWGGFNHDATQTVDARGNLFIPNVGPVKVLGVRNAELNGVVESQVKRTFRASVGVYATLEAAQPVKIYVTGFVRAPGLYAGLSSDSVLYYLDRAGGIDPARGSYLQVNVLRGGKARAQVDLYRFLLEGRIDPLQLQDGDTIVVAPRKHTVQVGGEVLNPYVFEFATAQVSAAQLLAMAHPRPGATHLSIVRKIGAQRRSEYHPLATAASVVIQDGDEVTLTSDKYPGTILVRIEGAHLGERSLVLPYGSRLQDAVARMKPAPQANIGALQLYRRSVAERQRELLEGSLRSLETYALTARSATSEEASLRQREGEQILQFVERARRAQPRGQVVLADASGAGQTLLEDGDVIRLPETSNVVLVSGEVLMPNALIYREGEDIESYIRRAGGYTQGADEARVLVVRQDGNIVEALPSARTVLRAGDELMVLPKVETKNIEVTRGITQIIYQIAVAARIALGL